MEGPANMKAAPDPSANVALVEIKDAWKFFDGTSVLRGVSLRLRAGEIHAVLGGNGAGKSTLMKIVAGLYRPERGEVRIQGQLVVRPSPSNAHRLGVYLVPQETMLFPSLTVFENITLRLPKPETLRPELERLMGYLDLRLDLRAPARYLDFAQQQLVEILRGLIRRARILILDEPTSALTPKESHALFERMRRLAGDGVGIFYISHKLNEIRGVCNYLSVLRDGVIVLEGSPGVLTNDQVISAMTTASLKTTRHPAVASESARSVLKVSSLSGEGFSKVSFSLTEGEILGLAGVVGAGRTELAETLVGQRAHREGSIELAGQKLARLNPRTCADAGLVYLPEDRQASGLFLDAPIHWNTSSATLHHEPWWLNGRTLMSRSEEFIKRLSIKSTGSAQVVRSLSGGNQQKTLIAKCLACHPRVLILDEPTRGVDVSARADIYDLIANLAESGVAVLIISSDFDEIAVLCRRVLVMRHGRICGEIASPDATPERIGEVAFGARA